MKRILTLSTCFFVLLYAVVYFRPKQISIQPKKATAQYFSGPAEFAKFHRDIRTAEGETEPSYRSGYKLKELSKSKQVARFKKARTQSNGVTAFTERGPANVPGRTRGLIIDPDDVNKNTWFAGSVGGGIWKTTNAGASWNNLTADLPNLATSVLAMSQSNPNIIYAGTGEGFFNLDAIDGTGIFKTADRGITWELLPSTLNFADVNRIVIDPTNDAIVCAATNEGIFRSTNGGNSWAKVLDEDFVQDLKATPGNFNIQYAAQNSVGIWKSIDAGVTWDLFNTNMGTVGRVELDISPVNTNRIFASAEAEAFGTGSILFMSNDGAETWSRVNVSITSEVDFLNGQGWYDNTIACDPFNQNTVYFAGVDMFRTQITSGSTNVNILGLEEDGTQDFLALTNFASATNGNFDTGPSANNTSIEIRFGPGETQKAHSFLVPEGNTTGVPAASYSYQDYVDVDFTVWDISAEPDRQLMVSFRDQGRDSKFNLILNNTSSAVATEQSREYLFVNNVSYSETQSASIATAGGHEFSEMYNIWPFLAAGGNWPPDQNGTLRITSSLVPKLNATTINITDGRGTFGNGKNNIVHVDHHNIVMIPMTASTYKILNANDGGVFVSNVSATPGINNGEWTATDNGYNSSQFYGADKRTGANQYFGGMQDNGTWLSPAGQTPAAGTDYSFKIGGDGFEVIWNNINTNLLIGGSQFNGFARSTNAGIGFSDATSGLSGDMPFISKLANSRAIPDRIFTLGANGVYVSQNFGQSWVLTPITQKWVNSSFMDIEVSRANANIVWAGTGMTADLNLHVSVDGGKTFSITNNFTTVSMGGITKLASHPSEENTAYALFSLSGKPKILKTTDLGVNWFDVSGFGTNNTSSSGFPDVAVYCLYVRPDNPNIIWAGTEIGIVESQDGGTSWSLLDTFPNVSVWDMKGVDDQIVIATHGRGIWTATINASQSNLPVLPVITAVGTSPDEKFAVLINSTEAFDSLQIFAGTSRIGSIENLSSGETIKELSGIGFGAKTISAIAFLGASPYITNTVSGKYIDLKATADSHADYFSDLTSMNVSDFQLNLFQGQINSRKTLHSKHNYVANAKYEAVVTVPIEISSTNANFQYRDVAIVEPSNDSVIVEATLDGVHWVSLTPAYDASENASWLTTFNTTGGVGQYSQMVEHNINLLDFFEAGDKVLFRFRLVSNPTIQAWGWAIDYVAIQQTPTDVERPITRSSIAVFPNPMPQQSTATLNYSVEKPSNVYIEVVSVLGSRIWRRDEGFKNAGAYSTSINISGLVTGSYIVVLKEKNLTKTTRLVVE